MEERLSRELIPKLLREAVSYHTRSGLRPNCNCRYCLAKIRGTNYVGSIGYAATFNMHVSSGSWLSPVRPPYFVQHPSYAGPPFVGHLTGGYLDDFEIWAMVKAERNRRIQLVREELKELKSFE